MPLYDPQTSGWDLVPFHFMLHHGRQAYSHVAAVALTGMSPAADIPYGLVKEPSVTFLSDSWKTSPPSLPMAYGSTSCVEILGKVCQGLSRQAGTLKSQNISGLGFRSSQTWGTIAKGFMGPQIFEPSSV